MRLTSIRFPMLAVVAIVGATFAFASVMAPNAGKVSADTTPSTTNPSTMTVVSVTPDTCGVDSWCLYCANNATTAICQAYPPIAQAPMSTTASAQTTAASGSSTMSMASAGTNSCLGDSWCLYCAEYPASSVCEAYPPIASHN